MKIKMASIVLLITLAGSTVSCGSDATKGAVPNVTTAAVTSASTTTTAKPAAGETATSSAQTSTTVDDAPTDLGPPNYECPESMDRQRRWFLGFSNDSSTAGDSFTFAVQNCQQDWPLKLAAGAKILCFTDTSHSLSAKCPASLTPEMIWVRVVDGTVTKVVAFPR
jgi:hypothetical protein